jgi:hypothetical protein
MSRHPPHGVEIVRAEFDELKSLLREADAAADRAAALMRDVPAAAGPALAWTLAPSSPSASWPPPCSCPGCLRRSARRVIEAIAADSGAAGGWPSGERRRPETARRSCGAAPGGEGGPANAASLVKERTCALLGEGQCQADDLAAAARCSRCRLPFEAGAPVAEATTKGPLMHGIVPTLEVVSRHALPGQRFFDRRWLTDAVSLVADARPLAALALLDADDQPRRRSHPPIPDQAGRPSPSVHAVARGRGSSDTIGGSCFDGRRRRSHLSRAPPGAARAQVWPAVLPRRPFSPSLVERWDSYLVFPEESND